MKSDEETMTVINSEINRAIGYENDVLVQNRAEALEYYYGTHRTKTPEGNSSAQSADVADMVEAVMSNMMPAFSGDTLVMFEAEGEDDIRQAKSESGVVNNQIMEHNRGYWEISSAIKDALLLRNAVMKCEVLEEEVSTSQKFSAVDDESIALALMTDDPNVTKEATMIKDLGDDTSDVTVATVTTNRTLEIVAVDPTRFLINENHDSIFIGDARFVSERDYPTRSDLLQEGYSRKMVDELPTYEQDVSIDAQARRRDASDIDLMGSVTDPSMEVLERFTSYLLHDRDGDGIAERHRYVSVGNTLLDDEIVDFHVYVAGSAYVNPHDYNSISLFDKMKQVQDIKTKVLQQWLDNLDANNHTTTVIGEGVNQEDAKSKRTGKVIRAGRGGPDQVKEMTIADLGSSSAAFLDYADKMRSEAGGASLDMQNAQMQIAGDTAHGVERQMGSKEQMAAIMCRNLAESLIRSLYLLVHKTLRIKMPGEITERLGSEFVTLDPGQWPARVRVNLKSGLSIQERAFRKRTMTEILMKQTELFQSGMDGVLTSVQSYHNALEDWSRASMVDNPERYWLDPMSEEAQQAAQQKQQQRAETAAKEKETNQMLFGIQNQLEQMQINLNKYEFDKELEFKYWKEQQLSEQKEAELVTEAAIKLVPPTAKEPS